MPAEDSLLFLRDLADVEPPRDRYAYYDDEDIYRLVPRPQWTGLEDEIWTPRSQEHDPQLEKVKALMDGSRFMHVVVSSAVNSSRDPRSSATPHNGVLRVKPPPRLAVPPQRLADRCVACCQKARVARAQRSTTNTGPNRRTNAISPRSRPFLVAKVSGQIICCGSCCA